MRNHCPETCWLGKLLTPASFQISLEMSTILCYEYILCLFFSYWLLGFQCDKVYLFMFTILQNNWHQLLHHGSIYTLFLVPCYYLIKCILIKLCRATLFGQIQKWIELSTYASNS